MPYLTTEEVAGMLRVTVYAVRSMLLTGKLSGRRVGKRWLVHHQELDKLLNDPNSTR